MKAYTVIGFWQISSDSVMRMIDGDRAIAVAAYPEGNTDVTTPDPADDYEDFMWRRTVTADDAASAMKIATEEQEAENDDAADDDKA